MVNGLSKFFSQNSNFDVKIVNKDVVLFKAFNNEKTRFFLISKYKLCFFMWWEGNISEN